MRKDAEFLQYEYQSNPIPKHTEESILNYILYGYKPGSFLTCLLSGDSFGAIIRADLRNVSNFEIIHFWILKNLPEESHGDIEKFNNWINDVNSVRTNYLKIKYQDYIKFVLEN